MNFDVNEVFPEDPGLYEGPQIIRVALFLILVIMVVRSCIHLFSSDGGAERIAGVDTSVEGGNNIIAMFHQWGAIQLLLAVVLVALFFRYPGFTPLILLAVALDPVLRFVASRKMKVTSTRTPPGAAFNGVALVVLTLLFVASVMG
jgi:hypothetical protein